MGLSAMVGTGGPSTLVSIFVATVLLLYGSFGNAQNPEIEASSPADLEITTVNPVEASSSVSPSESPNSSSPLPIDETSSLVSESSIGNATGQEILAAAAQSGAESALNTKVTASSLVNDSSPADLLNSTSPVLLNESSAVSEASINTTGQDISAIGSTVALPAQSGNESFDNATSFSPSPGLVNETILVSEASLNSATGQELLAVGSTEVAFAQPVNESLDNETSPILSSAELLNTASPILNETSVVSEASTGNPTGQDISEIGSTEAEPTQSGIEPFGWLRFRRSLDNATEVFEEDVYPLTTKGTILAGFLIFVCTLFTMVGIWFIYKILIEKLKLRRRLRAKLPARLHFLIPLNKRSQFVMMFLDQKVQRKINKKLEQQLEEERMEFSLATKQDLKELKDELLEKFNRLIDRHLPEFVLYNRTEMGIEILADNGAYLKGQIQSINPDGALVTYELDILPSKVVPFNLLRMPPAESTGTKVDYKEGDLVEVYGKSFENKEPYFGWYPAKLNTRKGDFLVVEYTIPTSVGRDVVMLENSRPVNANKPLVDGLSSFKKSEIPVPEDLREYSRRPNAHAELASAIQNCIVDYDQEKSQLIITSCYEQSIRRVHLIADMYFRDLRQKVALQQRTEESQKQLQASSQEAAETSGQEYLA